MAESDTSLSTLRVTCIFFMVLCFPVVAGRVALRASKKTLGWDDLVIVVAYILLLVFASMSVASVDHGLGVPTASPEDQVLSLKLFSIATFMYLFSTFFAKCSIALLLHRIASDGTRIRVFILASLALFVVLNLVSFILWGLQCSPYSAQWGEPGTCRSGSYTAVTAYYISTVDISYTWMYAILPVFMLWDVQMSLRTKLSVYALLGVNVISCVGSIIRLKYIIKIQKESATLGLSLFFVEAEATSYSVIEVGITIFVTSLAALKPLLKHLPWGGSSNGNSRSLPPSHLHASGRRGEFEFEMRGNARNNAIRLDDKSDHSGSQDEILQGPGKGIRKHAEFTVTYDPKAAV